MTQKKTNHSLKATGASTMFTAGVPEKLIKNITGHKSTKALEVYERSSTEQLQAVSKVMTTPNSSFSSEVRQVSFKVVEVYNEKHKVVKEKR